MSESNYFPGSTFAPPRSTTPVPNVLVAPPRYVQGRGVLQHVGNYLSILSLRTVAVLASSRGHLAEGQTVADSLASANMQVVKSTFTGECSLPTIHGVVEELNSASVDALVAVGGGKCVDAGKCVADRLGVPVIVVPTLASNDAPCSALSVLYTSSGVVTGAEFFRHSPAYVIVDTEVIAAASPRYLVAGMGDAMATWYEAKVCADNPHARNALGARPTLAASVLGQACANVLYDDGLRAIECVHHHHLNQREEITTALERVIEANTLLSGVGFESGGLAAAHGLAQGYTAVAGVEANFLHGEMVAMGVLAQLMMQDEQVEAERVARFFGQVGLPVTFTQLGFEPSTENIADVVAGSLSFEPIHNLPFEVTAETVRQGMLRADALGRSVVAQDSDQAYRRLQSL